jgi:hypothetical protein
MFENYKKGPKDQVFHQQAMEVRLERRREQIRTAFVRLVSLGRILLIALFVL